jgi:hypothetical protein
MGVALRPEGFGHCKETCRVCRACTRVWYVADDNHAQITRDVPDSQRRAAQGNGIDTVRVLTVPPDRCMLVMRECVR